MIKKIEVENFKALDGFKICNLPMFVVLTGLNGSGKTSFLELLQFIRELVSIDVSASERDIESYKTAFAKDHIVKIYMVVSLPLSKKTVEWSIQFNVKKRFLVREVVKIQGENTPILQYDKNVLSLALAEDSVMETKPSGLFVEFKSSILYVLKDSPKLQSALKELQVELSGISVIGVLNPSAIAMSTRPVTKGRKPSIDFDGRGLPTFVNSLSVESKRHFWDDILRFYDGIEELNVKGTKFGWKRIMFKELGSVIDGRSLSYGTLRFMVMAALKHSNATICCFDEVENGFNQEAMAQLVEMLKSYSVLGKQLFVTTHSPVFLNYLEDEIAKNGVYFTYRNRDHRSRCIKFYNEADKAAELEYHGAGQVMALTDLKELAERLSFHKAGCEN